MLPLQVIRQNSGGSIESGFFESLRSTHDIRVRRPTDLGSDGLTRVLLETWAHNSVSSSHAEQESANMRPVRDRRTCSRHGAIQELGGEPERDGALKRHLK